jgi:excisionase family DNA binding protein
MPQHSKGASLTGEFFSIGEVALAVGGQRTTVVRAVLEGRLAAVRLRERNRWRFLIPRDALEQYIAQRKNG